MTRDFTVGDKVKVKFTEQPGTWIGTVVEKLLFGFRTGFKKMPSAIPVYNMQNTSVKGHVSIGEDGTISVVQANKFPAPAGDNTALFEAMDRMSAEIPAEEWHKVPTYQMGVLEDHGSMIAAYGAPPPPKDWQPPLIEPLAPEDLRRFNEATQTPQRCQVCGKHGLHLCELPEPPPTKWFYPSQPWRRGPLAAWTLVNISAHDGRLTVVIKRGRGELIDETGSDDETLWERLSAKVVEFEKRKAASGAKPSA